MLILVLVTVLLSGAAWLALHAALGVQRALPSRNEDLVFH